MPRTNPVALWLFTCCGMIFVMALIGAITRLTESGLSITSWDPIVGSLPPLNQEAWDKAFTAYQKIPQYQILNRGMSLDEFKTIFFWEWVHRLWGRLIGIVFAVPLIVFIAKRRIDRRLAIKLVAIFALGGLQGFIGWFMVQSGLEVRTSVSPYRLALHLSFALLLYALLLWVGLAERKRGINDKAPLPLAGGTEGGLPDRELVFASSPTCESGALFQGWLTLILLTTTIIWGAFVAGLHAGEAYNTWPLMDGDVLPDAAWTLQPVWLNIFENLALVQFAHRWLGPTTLLLILSWVARRWKNADGTNKSWLRALAVMAFVQVGLGLSTLLSHVNIVLAVTHQAGAITLLTLMLINLHRLCDKTIPRK